MNIRTKIGQIAKPDVKTTFANPALGLKNQGDCDTIKIFFDEFIKNRLPSPQQIRDWNRMLLDYVKTGDAKFGIRSQESVSKKTKATTGYSTLRRGCLTQTSEGYYFYFSDNFLASGFYKMALDGDTVADLKEFIELNQKKEFPFRFDNRYTDEEKAIQGLPLCKTNPGFGTAGYKLSHVLDSGDGYFFKGKNLSISDIKTFYLSVGERKDYQLDPMSKSGFHLRNLATDPDARALAVACFLRFANPINYYLTPKVQQPKCHQTNIKIPYNDIGEYQELRDYIITLYRNIYKQDYEDFLKLALFDERAIKPFYENKYIGIHYDLNGIGGVSSPAPKSPTSLRIPDEAKKAIESTGIKINQITYTYASIKKVSKKAFPANPNADFLKNDWYIFLDNIPDKTVMILRISPNSLQFGYPKIIGKFALRHDSQLCGGTKKDRLNLSIQKSSLIDIPSKINLSAYMVQKISY